MLNKYIFKKTKIDINWSIVMPVMLLVFISLITLYGTKGELLVLQSNFFKHLVFFITGLILFYYIQLIRTTFFYEMA